MNVCRYSLAGGSARWCVGLQLVVLLVVSGCGTGSGTPPPEGRLAIENVAKWYQLYRADHGGEPPANEEEFVGFVESELQSRGQPLDADLRKKLLTSPRDGQRYVINYGEPTSDNPERNVAVYEKEGYDGKRLVGFEFGSSREVDEAELESLLAGDG